MFPTNSSTGGRCHASLRAASKGVLYPNAERNDGACSLCTAGMLVSTAVAMTRDVEPCAGGTSHTHACPCMNTVVSASPRSYSSIMYCRYTEASLPLPLAMCGQQDSASTTSVSLAAVASAHAKHVDVSMGTRGNCLTGPAACQKQGRASSEDISCRCLIVRQQEQGAHSGRLVAAPNRVQPDTLEQM
jgi:hypothetical protein